MTRKKSRGPALYEVIGKRSAPGSGQAMPTPPARRKANRSAQKQVRAVRSKPPVAQSSDVANSGSRRWMVPGSAIRMPVGVVVAAGVLVVILVMMSYMVGHRRGRDIAVAQLTVGATEAPINQLATGQQAIADPLGTPTSEISVSPLPGAAGDQSLGGNAHGSGAWGEIRSDSRISGLNYFVLAEWHGEEMVALAEFCRTRGLETYVVPGKNERFHRVITVPGFESSQRNDQWVLELESEIHEAGRAWKRAGGGRDLSDAYPSLYRSAR